MAVAVETVFAPHPTTGQSRIRVRLCEDRKIGTTVPWDYSGTTEEEHNRAFERFRQRMIERAEKEGHHPGIWLRTDWTRGATDRGYVFVLPPAVDLLSEQTDLLGAVAANLDNAASVSEPSDARRLGTLLDQLSAVAHTRATAIENRLAGRIDEALEGERICESILADLKQRFFE